MKTSPNSLTSKSKKYYKSPFKDWNKLSWVQSKLWQEENSFLGLPFSPEMTPLALHPEISKNTKFYLFILAYRLLEHLQFTSLVELNYVNPICSDLLQGKTAIKLTEEQRFDLLKIYCDEGEHSLLMELFSRQVETNYGISHKILGHHQFELNFQKLLEAEFNVSHNLIKLFLTNIIETLYVGAYSGIPYDKRIAPAVRAVIEDHIADEAKHHIYFRNMFPLLWNSISDHKKEQVGQLLPKLLRTFLEPNLISAGNVLQYLGFSAADSSQILQEVYLSEKITQTICRVAKPTIKMFDEAGVFSIPSVKKVFQEYQLLV